jgi:hypothetical protein
MIASRERAPHRLPHSRAFDRTGQFDAKIHDIEIEAPTPRGAAVVLGRLNEPRGAADTIGAHARHQLVLMSA